MSEQVSEVLISGRLSNPNIQFPPKDSLLHNISNEVVVGAPSGHVNIIDATPFSIDGGLS